MPSADLAPLLSIFTVTSVVPLTLPAVSVQVPETFVPAVSAVRVLGAVHEATPLGPTSPADAKFTVTSVLFQPAALAGGVLDPVGAFGALLSSFTVTSVLALVLPALSVQVPETTVDAVSVVRVVGAVHEAMPLSASVDGVNETVTLALFQPAAFGAGTCDAAGASGAVLSIFTVTSVAPLTLPAVSVHVPETTVPPTNVSAVRVVGAVHEATPLGPTSPADTKLTVTSVLFQPAALAGGVLESRGRVGSALVELHRDVGAGAGVARVVNAGAGDDRRRGVGRQRRRRRARGDAAQRVGRRRERDRDVGVVPARRVRGR